MTNTALKSRIARAIASDDPDVMMAALKVAVAELVARGKTQLALDILREHDPEAKIISGGFVIGGVTLMQREVT